ncbi:hypothetical protein MBLNU230_g6888t1 [Neophaeotheca triangularis]
MRFPLTLAVALLLKTTTAVFADEAWNIDYHYALLGEPQKDATFFHQPNPSSPASLIYTLSDQGVLGAVNPRDGNIVWRQRLENDSDNTFLRAGDGQSYVISGIGRQVAAWSAGDGRQAWVKDMAGEVADVEILELSDGKDAPAIKDAVAISRGDQAVVQRLDGATGATKWEYNVEGSDVPYQVSASSTEIFAILLQKSMLGYIKIRVVSLDPVSGKKTDEYTLSSDNELSSADTILAVGANSAAPIIAWSDAAYSALKINILGTKGVSSFNIEKHGENKVDRVQIQAPDRVNSLAHFLVHYASSTAHWAEVYHIDLKTSKVEKAYSLPKVTGQGSFSVSTADANVYFTRVTEGQVSTVSSTSHGILGKWDIEGFGSATKSADGYPVHGSAELSMKGETVSAIRTVILLASGEWVLLRGGTPMWNRPEMLASTVAATFATPLEVQSLAHELETEAHSNVVAAYIHRVKRHVEGLQYLPELLQSLPQRIIGGFLGTSEDAIGGSDAFGFHKVVVCATSNGRLVGLDSGSPDRILWNVKLDVPVEKKALRLDSPEPGILGLNDKFFVNASTGGQVDQVVTPLNEQPEQTVVKYTLNDRRLEATKEGRAIWNFSPPKNERILSLVPRPLTDPVASIGKVLGDRKVLYKYLSPNLALLVTAHDLSKTASVHVLDTTSGSTLHSTTHAGVDLSRPIPAVVTENWFAYSITAEASETVPKGHQLVVGELFESLVPNDRGPLTGSTNFSSIDSSIEPFTLTQTFQIPEAITKLAVTQTRQGITSRQLLAVLEDSNSIVGIPRGVIDPRRPVNRDPTKLEQMEGLVRYAPVIEFDPKWYLNHKREVLGISSIVTAPAILESTSLVFAYGLDVFGTRMNPSFSFDILGKDFNKFQMLATVAALAVVTFLVAPLVKRKQVDTRWRFL